jgi:hypothetical protein
MKQLFTLILSLCIIVFAKPATAQQIIVTDDASYTTPASGSMLDVKSTTKGFIVPRMTTAQRTTLGGTSPVNGVVVYDTELKSFWYWENDVWNQIAASGLNLTNIKFGDAANYSTFEADGTLMMYGTATVWDDIMIPGLATRSNTNPPSFLPFIGGTFLNYFDDAGANSENQVYFTVQFPHSWAGSTIYPHVHWTPETDPGAASSVRWGLEYSWVEYNSTTPNTFPVTTTVFVDAPCAAGSQQKHLISSFGSVALTTSQDGISSMMVCRLYRNSSSSSDTYNNKRAGFLQFDIHFEKNTEGSRQEFIK